jgi:L-lactate dehydrogenase complex protein LldE
VRVALFVPCYVDQLAPGVGLASVRVLERAGCEVTYRPDQPCCGQPLLNLGARRQAAALARGWLAMGSDCEAVVSPSASCVSMVRRHYQELGVLEREESRALAERTYELSEFLVEVLGRTELGAVFPHRVALLQSCHGLRELGLGHPSEAAQPARGPGPAERLLSCVEGLELVAPGRDECCGFGGAFSFRFPELSTRMGRDRLAALGRGGAEYVTASDSSCLLHLEGLRARQGFGPRSLHLAELLAGSGEQ